MISKNRLEDLYLNKKKSMQEIADELGYSLHKVKYWMEKHEIKIRNRSDATYIKRNPFGDPFHFRRPQNTKEAELFGLGIGLYWGEGTKANKDSVRLGNTDPELLNHFIKFLEKFFSVGREDLRFGLQIFTDIPVDRAMDFWIKKLKIRRSQFYKPLITRSGSIGTYRKKSEYGVLTVMYHNKKLRNLLISLLPM
jgi:hypothetical protein